MLLFVRNGEKKRQTAFKRSAFFAFNIKNFKRDIAFGNLCGAEEYVNNDAVARDGKRRAFYLPLAIGNPFD